MVKPIPVDTAPSTGLGDAAAHGTAITLSVQSVQFLLQVGSVVVLSRMLVPADFGLVGMVTAVIGIAYLLQDFGLSVAAIQSASISDPEQANLFWANLVLGALCGAIAIACTPLIVALYREPALVPIILVLSSLFLMSGFAAQYKARLAREFRFAALAVTDLAAQGLSILLAIAAAALGMGFWAIVLQQVMYSLTNCVLLMAVTRWNPGLPIRGASIRRFFRFGVGVVGTQAIAYATRNVDNIAIGVVWGATPLGFYSRAFQLMVAPINKIDGPMTRVALPILSKVQDDDIKLTRYLKRAQMVSCYVTASLLAVMAGLSYPIVRTIFGERWLPVAPIFGILAAGGVFRTIGQIAYWAYLVRGVTDRLLRQRTVTGLVTVVLILAGTPWGAIGVATGSSAAASAFWLVAMIHVGRAAAIDSLPLLRNALKIVSAVGIPCGVCGLIGSMLPIPAILQIFAGIVCAGLYVATAAVLIPWMRADVAASMVFVRRSLTHRRPEIA